MPKPEAEVLNQIQRDTETAVAHVETTQSVTPAQRAQIANLVAKGCELDILYDVQLMDGNPDSVTIFTRRQADEAEG